MKLYERFGDRGFHTSVIATFGVDFDAFETIALSRLRGSGCHNNMLVADARMLTHALSESSALPQYAGRLYSLSGATASGVFHPKLILQLGRRQGRLIIGSANATASGLAGNLELAAVVECDQEISAAQFLVATAWQYLRRVLDRDHRAVAQQVSWMEARTPWLRTTEPTENLVELSDGTQAAFLGTNGETGIMNRFTRHVGSENIERLVVLSPYWDRDLSALKELCERLQPKETLLLIDKDRALFPSEELSSLNETRILDVSTFAGGRFVHAKLIVAQTIEADHALFGSANCTVAALGREGFAGLNEETCLYRRVPAGAICRELKLDQVIEEEAFLNPADIPELATNKDLPFDDLSSRCAGTFECLFETIIWRPSAAFMSRKVDIDLLTASETALPCSFARLARSTESEVHFAVSGLRERPAFARVKLADGSVSALSVVALVDELRAELREARGKAAERAVAQLEEETEEGLWLLEVLDDLEAARHKDVTPRSRKVKRMDTSEDNQQEFDVLDYKTFVEGCRLRTEQSSVGRNSLSGTELSVVRAFLNRVIGFETSHEAATMVDVEKEFTELADLGDDVSNAEEAMEQGDLPGNSRGKISTPKHEDSRRKKRAIRRRQDLARLKKATQTFISGIREAAGEGELTSVDILRLRSMLAIVAMAGTAGTEQELRKEGTGTSRSSLQVLPKSGNEPTWPGLLGKLLFSVFGGNYPAVDQLTIEGIYDQVPDDLLECWATCFWAIQARIQGAGEKPVLGLSTLTEQVYALTRLRPEELHGNRILQLMECLGNRFAVRLGLDSQAIIRAHRDYVARLLS